MIDMRALLGGRAAVQRAASRAGERVAVTDGRVGCVAQRARTSARVRARDRVCVWPTRPTVARHRLPRRLRGPARDGRPCHSPRGQLVTIGCASRAAVAPCG
jgi:hypothetical protein